jgi:DNA-binding NtrC family response regulator
MESPVELKGKKVLAVDDEPDVLDSIEGILSMCEVEKVQSFKEAKHLLETKTYDAAILDIMGVDGYRLLEVTTKLDIPTLMLTAHALNPQNLVKSVKKGASAYIPKEKLTKISVFLADVLEERQSGKRHRRWFQRLESFFEEKFDRYWKERMDEGKEFWKKYFY